MNLWQNFLHTTGLVAKPKVVPAWRQPSKAAPKRREHHEEPSPKTHRAPSVRSFFEAGRSGTYVEHPHDTFYEVAGIFRRMPPGVASLDAVTHELKRIGARFVSYADGAPGDNAYRPEWRKGGHLDAIRGTVSPAKLGAEWRKVLGGRS